MKRSRAPKKAADELVEALDAGYQRSHYNMFKLMVSRGFELLGQPAWEPVPEDAKAQVDQALQLYIQRVRETWIGHDILGSTYMQLVSRWGKSALSQYFTPESLSFCLARMNLHGAESGPKPGGGLWTLMEPCAGSGVMMLQAMRVIAEEHGPQALRWWSFTGIDLDGLCARMTGLQLLLNCEIHDVPLGELRVFEGNSLAPPDSWRTVLHASARSDASNQDAVRLPAAA